MVTINGRVPDTFAVRKGERIRLRLINAANARIFSPDFTGFQAGRHRARRPAGDATRAGGGWCWVPQCAPI